MKKTLTMVLAFALIFALGIGATLAWLTATSDTVTNTFTIGDINIELKEHQYVPGTKNLSEVEVTGNDNYKYVPGDTLPKDPFVRVQTGSEDCWLFVKVTESNNTVTVGTASEKVINYTVDPSVWTPVSGTTNVWYKSVSASDVATEAKTYSILSNNQVTVSENVTKDMVADLTTNKAALTFEAYAIQSANLKDASGNAVATAAQAWAVLNH